MKMNVLEADAWDETLDKIRSDMNGQPLNIHGLMANHPDLLKAWWPLRNHGVSGGTLGDRLGELAILRTAVRMECWYEWASHVDRALSRGLSMEEIERVRTSGQGDWAEKEWVLLEAVDCLLESGVLGESILARLEAHYSTAQQLDLVAITGMYRILGCMIKTWDPPLDASVEQRLPDGVDRDSFEASARTD